MTLFLAFPDEKALEMEDDPDNDTQDELIHEALMERSAIARYLRAIADGVESGSLRLSSGDEQLVLRPSKLCAFELRAKEEQNRVKLRLRLAWRKTDEAQTGRKLLIES